MDWYWIFNRLGFYLSWLCSDRISLPVSRVWFGTEVVAPDLDCSDSRAYRHFGRRAVIVWHLVRYHSFDTALCNLKELRGLPIMNCEIVFFYKPHAPTFDVNLKIVFLQYISMRAGQNTLSKLQLIMSLPGTIAHVMILFICVRVGGWISPVCVQLFCACFKIAPHFLFLVLFKLRLFLTLPFLQNYHIIFAILNPTCVYI